MSGTALLRATFADAAEAERIGRAVIEEELAACVNLLGPSRSIYRWRGEVEAATEERALFKTTSDLAPALAARIAELHSYDLPAIAYWTVTAPTAVAQWVMGATRT